MRKIVLISSWCGSDKSESAEDVEEEVTRRKKPEEIIADLEAVLTVTAEELEQQKKLNQSLLKRKVSVHLSEWSAQCLNHYIHSTPRISKSLN